MAAIDIKDVQQVLDQIQICKTTIKQTGEEGRSRMEEIKVDEACNKIPLSDGKVDANVWAKLTENEQTVLYHQLIFVLNTLRDAAGVDGPTNPRHIMHNEYASSVSIVLSTVLAFLLTVALLAVIVCKWGEATGTDAARKVESVTAVTKLLKEAEERTNKSKQDLQNAEKQLAAAKEKKKRQAAETTVAKLGEELKTAQASQGKIVKEALDAITAYSKNDVTEKTVLLMVILLGTLGGSLHLVSSLVVFIGNRKLKKSWIPYYLAMPVTGAGLAPVIYMLLRVGLISPSGTAANGSGLANLNLIAIYAFAVMSGLFSRVALDKLSEVFKTMFSKSATPPSADALTSQKAKGDGATPAS